MRMFLAKRLQPPRCTTFFRGITNSSISRLSSFDIHPEVQDALSSGKPVVALESALITHGFPPTESPALALSLEKSVRSTGSIPATIAVLKGRVKIGLEPRELDLLVSEPAVKVSRRDIGPAIALKANGGTTICSTSIFAAKAGIKIFATGGLGGVHRGGEISMDVSADLPELTRNQVAVVSAGVKSILDIRRTLEYLETLGVPVVAYSKRPDFPAFFGARSGFQVPWNTDDPQKIAEILFAQWNGLNLENGALIAVPIPEEHEARAAEIQACVDQAVAESESNGVARSGKDVTPWLLNRVKELTHGQSKESNIALLHNTAIVGGQIAVQYQKLLGNREPTSPLSPFPLPASFSATLESNVTPSMGRADLAIVGCSAIDVTATSSRHGDDIAQTTTPGVVSLALGGVARNIAEAAHRVLSATSHEVTLVTPHIRDAFGILLETETKGLGMRTDGFISWETSHRTAVCNMLLDQQGSLFGGVADMDVVEALPSDKVLSSLNNIQPQVLCWDGNLAPKLMKDLVETRPNAARLFFEPTSVAKSSRLFDAFIQTKVSKPSIHFSSPNLQELKRMHRTAESLDLFASEHWWNCIDSYGLGTDFRHATERLSRLPVSEAGSSESTLSYLRQEGIFTMAVQLLPYISTLIVKLGSHGVLLVQDVPSHSKWRDERGLRIVTTTSGTKTIAIQHFPAMEGIKVVNVTGAGDSLVGTLLANLVVDLDLFEDPEKARKAINRAQQAAALTLQSSQAVSPLLSGVLL